MAKYLSKYLMYISFPIESSNNHESNYLKNFEDQKSERLLRKYMFDGLTQKEKNELLGKFKAS